VIAGESESAGGKPFQVTGGKPFPSSVGIHGEQKKDNKTMAMDVEEAHRRILNTRTLWCLVGVALRLIPRGNDYLGTLASGACGGV
jgi:hypothetical protein